MIIVADLKILLDADKGSFGDVHFAWFVPLPDNLRRPAFPINLGTIEGERFSDAHAGDTQDFCQGPVTQTWLRMRGNGIEKTLHLFFGEILHLVLGDLWPAYFGRVKDCQTTHISEIAQETPQAEEHGRHRRG